MVTVSETDSIRGGYKIHCSGKEGWVPSYVLNLLTSSPRRGPAWTFRKFRKPSFSGSVGRKDSTGGGSMTGSPTSPNKTITTLKGSHFLLHLQRCVQVYYRNLSFSLSINRTNHFFS